MGSSFLKMAVQLGIIYLYARKLSLEDYGQYQSVWLYTNVVSVISLFGFSSLILSAPLSSIKDWIKQNQRRFYTTAFLLNFVPLVYILFIAVGFDWPVKLLLIAMIFLQNTTIITEAIAIKKEKEMLVLISNMIFNLAYLLCHLFILYSHYSLQNLLAWLIILFLAKFIIQWYFIKAPELTSADIISDQKLSKQLFYLGLFDIINVLSKWLDKWVILFFVSVKQFAVYFNGAYEIPVFGLMLSAVGNITLVELAKQPKNVMVNTKLLFNKSTALLSAIVFPSFCFLFFYHSEFFTLIFGNKYQEAIPIFLISIFVLPLRITNFTAPLQVYQRNDLIVKGATLEIIIAIVLMLLLYPLMQMKGLALAFVLSTYVQAGYYLWHTGKLINKNIGYFFPFKKLLFTMGISFLISGFGYFIFKYVSYPTNMIAGIIVTILLMLAFLFQYARTNKTLL